MSLLSVLEKTRRDLLDLSTRNRLIHTSIDADRSNGILISGQDPDSLFLRLVRQTKTFTFDSVAESSDSATTEPSDVSLRTHFTRNKLRERLLKCFFEARTAEEEQGSSILYLALGFLQWRELGPSTIDRFAPLLLVPVDLYRDNANSQFRLKFRDDEMVTNLSIQARLLQDFGIRFPDLPESVMDDDDWTPSKYFKEVNKSIRGQSTWRVRTDDVLLGFFSFSKFLMFRDLSPEAWPKNARLEKNKLLRSLLVDGFRDSSGPGLPADGTLDKQLNPADCIHVTDADSSQAAVIHEIAQGRNLLVQGPPGTGKSQTITNAIAAAVHAGKRVLFVSEKMAALDVVKRRLDSLGLGPITLELHSHKTRKHEILENLKSTLEIGAPTTSKSVPVDELRKTVDRLKEQSSLFHEPIAPSGVSPYRAMAEVVRLRAAQCPTLQSYSNEAMRWNDSEFQSRRQITIELDKLMQLSPFSNVWAGVRCKPMLPADVERLCKTLRDVQPALRELIESSRELAKQLGVDAPPHSAGTSELAELAQYMVNCPEGVDRDQLTNARWDSEHKFVEKTLDTIERLRTLRSWLSERVTDAALRMDWIGPRQSIAAHGASVMRFVFADYRKALFLMRGSAKGKIPTSQSERMQWLDAILEYQSTLEQLERDSERCRSLLGTVFDGIETPIEAAREIVRWIREGASIPAVRHFGRVLVARSVDAKTVARLLPILAKNSQEVECRLAEIVKQLKLHLPSAFHTECLQHIPLDAWMERIDDWLEQSDQLSHYLAVRSRLDRLSDAGLKRFAIEIDNGSIQPGKITDNLDSLRYNAVLTEAWRRHPELGEFQGTTYEELRARFAKLDHDRILMSRWEVAKAHFDNLPCAAADSGQVGILRREINKKRRHIPIRRLLREAGQAIQKIKPVFMMSPLSIAQYLEPGAVEFDLLVIDEASQIQPVDALGAIARCKQLVVVGDQRQLPPTTFFGREMGESEDLHYDDQDADSAGDVESILGLCESQGMATRMLTWHYRSKHESLIAVSNQRFYENKLFIVPSPMASGDSLGLKFRFVPDGRYDRGGSRTNRLEAIAIAEAVMRHAQCNAELSLGVVAFSSAQRDAILDEVEQRRRAEPKLEAFFMNGGPAPFFVKSLENVQGDERDVILISVGYGKDEDGKLSQNFGPLNREGGERRLNVLISRAAACCEVYSSIRACDIDLTRTPTAGVEALHHFLAYAESGTLQSAVDANPARDVFEGHLANTLRSKGYEVVERVGVGGFHIDLGIRDPETPGRFLMGIECDGQQYRTSPWIRDRDRLRPQILELRGWKMHRVWIADWFQNPEQQTELILKAIKKARSQWNEIDRSQSASPLSRTGSSVASRKSTKPFWTRSTADEGSIDSARAIDYTAADFVISDEELGLMDLTDRQLQKAIRQIAIIEAPISVDEIGRRLLSLLGKGRMIATVRDRIDEAIGILADRGSVEVRKGFLYLPEQEVFPVRNRRSTEISQLRKLENIAPEEIRSALMQVIAEGIGTEAAETVASATRLLGISNSQAVQENLLKTLASLKSKSQVRDRDGKLFIVA